MLEKDVHQLPQYVIEHLVRLLHDAWIRRRYDEHIISEGYRFVNRADKRDGQQATAMTRREHLSRRWIGRGRAQHDDHVILARKRCECARCCSTIECFYVH